MLHKTKRFWWLTGALTAVVAAVGSVGSTAAVVRPKESISPVLSTESSLGVERNKRTVTNWNEPAVYIVRFKELPIALYDGSEAGLAAPERIVRNKRQRLNLQGSAAKRYEAFLGEKQSQRLTTINQTLGRSVHPQFTFKHALNAVVVELTPVEAERVAKIEGVASVEREKVHELDTDVGPGFIGASPLWWDVPNAAQDTLFATGFENNTPYRGEGVVIGVIDTGYNSASPSFSGTDQSGYTFTNPLGAGNYLGQCNVQGISVAGCNNKVIGVYAFANSAVEDLDNHGSHTASTAAGNSRTALYNGNLVHLAGVAPHANLVIYNGCCNTTTIINSIDQAIQDAVIDVLSFSISGGTSPWQEGISTAFLSATNAGIFVAAAGGNDGKPNSVNNQSPWVTTVAANEHTRGPIDFLLSITGPGSPPLNVQNIALTAGDGSASLAGPLNANLVLSPQFNSGLDGCQEFNAGAFANSIALLRGKGSGGSCTPVLRKVQNAIAAGAVAVIIANPGYSFDVAGTNVPVYSISEEEGMKLQNFLVGVQGNRAPANIPYPAIHQPAHADKLASFSSLGPVNFDVIKPDIQAPGVDILAAIARHGSSEGKSLVGMYSGTSMATPHTAGAGALLVGLHPDWAPMEIKSALMMTAAEAGLTKSDGITLSDPFDRGSGSIRVNLAHKAGLVLNETYANFLSAEPRTGGNPSTLNLASMQNNNCQTITSPTTSESKCSFTRTLRSTQNHDVTWTATVTGLNTTLTPSNFTVAANGTTTIVVNVDASSLPSDGNFHFGELLLTPDDNGLPPLHIPMAIRVPAPNISTYTTDMNIHIPNNVTERGISLVVLNTGGPTLNVTNTNLGGNNSGTLTLYQAPNGYLTQSIYHPDRPLDESQVLADDFEVTNGKKDLRRITMYGYSAKGHLGIIHFKIYRNYYHAGLEGNIPDGVPIGTTTPSNNAPVWSYSTTEGAPGLTFLEDELYPDLNYGGLVLDLEAANVPALNLLPGTYWLTVYAELPSSPISYSFDWYRTTNPQLNPSVQFTPITMPQWLINQNIGNVPWKSTGFAMKLEQYINCGAPWLSITPSTLTLPGMISQEITVTADSTKFPVGQTEASAYLCLQSNDPDEPVRAIRVNAAQLQ